MRHLLVITLLFGLHGCTAMLLGDTGAGGSTHDPRSASQMASDSAITAAVYDRLLQDSAVDTKNLQLKTNGSRVTLQGTVGSYAARERAEALARGVDGVAAVNNQLRVTSSEDRY